MGSKVVLFLLIPISSFYLNKDQVGTFDILLVTASLCVPIISFQVAEASYRYLKGSNSQLRAQMIFQNSLIILLIGYALFIVSLGVLQIWIDSKLLFCLFLLVSTVFFTNSLMLIFRGLGKIKQYAILGVVFGLLAISSVVYSLQVFGTLEAVCISLFSSALLSVSMLFLHQKLWTYGTDFRLSVKVIAILLMFSLPLIPNAISWWLLDLGNRYVITFTLGSEANGVYAIAARYLSILVLLNSLFLVIWQDKVLNNSYSIESLKRYFTFFLKLEIMAVITITAMSYLLIKFAAGKEFIGAYSYIGLLGISAFFSSMTGIAGAFYLKSNNTRGLLITTIIGGLASISLSLILINYIGLYGVIVGSIAGFSITFMIRYLRLDPCDRIMTLNTPVVYFGILLYIIVYAIQFLENEVFSVITLFVLVITFALYFKSYRNSTKQFL